MAPLRLENSMPIGASLPWEVKIFSDIRPEVIIVFALKSAVIGLPLFDFTELPVAWNENTAFCPVLYALVYLKMSINVQIFR